MKTAIAIMALSITTGCASVMNGGGGDSMEISTTGCEEDGKIRCEVFTDNGDTKITAPARITVERDKDPITVVCSNKKKTATGELVVESGYNAMNVGNLLIGGVIGIGIDAATGAMWKYPDAVVVPMDCDE